MADRRLTAGAVAARKGGAPIVMITAYDAPFAHAAEEAGIDLLLVGDSLGMVVLGYDSTVPVTLHDMLRHTAAVVRGTHQAHVVADLPFLSYQVSDEEAVRSAGTLIKDGGALSVKLEGGAEAAPRIAAIVRAGIPVMGHIGLLPQTAGLGPGYRTRSDRERLLADARAVEAAGAYAVVLEKVDAEAAGEVTRALRIPTIGIGAGAACDGQVLVMHDVLGLVASPPPFAKAYARIGEVAREALTAYAAEVRAGAFPAK